MEPKFDELFRWWRDASSADRMKLVKYWIDKFAAKGLIYDSGERRDGLIVWKSTPLGGPFLERDGRWNVSDGMTQLDLYLACCAESGLLIYGQG